MKSTYLASTALALVLSTGVAFAAGPEATITDSGDANTSYVEQKATSNDSKASIEQAGSNNKASGLRSFSAYNYGAAIVQDGAGNSGHISQSGTGSNAYIEQAGTNNKDRDGYSYGAEILQGSGSNNEAYVSQKGSEHIVKVTQDGSNESARVVQTGLHSATRVSQSGSLDFAERRSGRRVELGDRHPER